MELRQLRYFLAVAEELSFTKAAQRLYVSQSTISQQVSTLERELGCTLFVRDVRHIALTSMGADLLLPARQTMDAADRVIATARAAAGDIDCITLAITTDSPVAAAYVDMLRRALPNCRIRLQPAPIVHYARSLVSGQVDGLLGLLPLDPTALTWRVLAEDALVLAVRSDQAFADADALQVADVLELPMADLDPRIPSDFADYWTLADHRNGDPPPRVGPTASSPDEVGQRVLFEGAVAVTFASMTMPRNGIVREVPLVDAGRCRLVLAHRRDDRRPLINTLDEVADAVAALHGSLR